MILESALLFLSLLCLFLGYKLYHLKIQNALYEEKLRFAQAAHEELSSTFKALSQEALQTNNRLFLDLAQASLEKLHEGAKGDLELRKQSIEALVRPVKESLTTLNDGLKALEKERQGDHTTLKTQLTALFESERRLRQETNSLTKALRAPLARGHWGEMQLRRSLELSGMLSHCDFIEQETSEDGRHRPDLIVKLPGGRQVIIDAKAPMEAYLDAMETEDEDIRNLKLKEHARQVRNHALLLSKKSYHQQFQPSPEFIVLFLPSENFFSAALSQDPSLIDISAEQGVILATPTTLIALLRAVAFGWKQESLTRHIEQVSQLAHELCKRLSDMTSHFAKTGRALNTAVEAYNQTVRSLESRVLVTARKFQEMGAASAELELEAPPPIEKISQDVTT